MGVRERLETIKSSNKTSYDDFFDDKLFDPKLIQPRVGNPWLSIWLRPRTTIRAIVESEPGYRVITIILLVGLSKALIRASARHFGDHLPFVMVIGICAVLGPLLMLVSLWLSAALLRRIGTYLGGQATSAEIRAAIAWGSVPYLAVLVLWIPALILIGSDLFVSNPKNLLTQPLPRLALFLMYLDDLIMLLWGVVLTLACLIEVFRMSVWRVLLAIVLMIPPFLAILMGPLILGVIALRIVMTPPAPTPDPVPIQPFVNLRRISPQPAPQDGLAARAIWDAGYRVNATTRTLPSNQTIVTGLELNTEVPRAINDEILEHLRDVPDLEVLTINFGSGLTDAGLKHLGHLKKLQRLEISFASISDKGLKYLSELTQLRELVLNGCDHLMGRGLIHLKPLNSLRLLHLEDSQIHGKALSLLAQHPLLTNLNLAGTGTTDDDLVHLSGLKFLQNLDLSAGNPIHGPGLAHLKALRNLQTLALGNVSLSDQAVEPLIQLKKLRTLDVTGSLISPSGMTRLRQGLPTVNIKPAANSIQPADLD